VVNKPHTKLSKVTSNEMGGYCLELVATSFWPCAMAFYDQLHHPTLLLNHLMLLVTCNALPHQVQTVHEFQFIP
jgi:hypothetical protein